MLAESSPGYYCFFPRKSGDAAHHMDEVDGIPTGLSRWAYSTNPKLGSLRKPFRYVPFGHWGLNWTDSRPRRRRADRPLVLWISRKAGWATNISYSIPYRCLLRMHSISLFQKKEDRFFVVSSGCGLFFFSSCSQLNDGIYHAMVSNAPGTKNDLVVVD